MSLGGADKCVTCGKSVYPMEKFVVDGLVFHKGKCFVCDFCKNPLRPGNYAGLSGKYYCKPHFKKLFQVKGNYSEGFGEEDPKKKWAPSGIAAAGAGQPAAPAAEEKKPEPAHPNVSLKGLKMKEIEHAQALFEKYDSDFNKKIDSKEFLEIFKELSGIKGEKFGAYALKKKSTEDFEKYAVDGGIDEASFLQVYSDYNLAVHMADKQAQAK